ncbi:unnamed protein product [marine sediment metagenome]|uniref:Helix-turn-helix domain-containing protein n=1 Tax=marine sediment metagenome TaxID=412755 RepID=X1NBD5_9ZZZZ
MSKRSTGDMTATEVKEELHCANEKLWKMLNAGDLPDAYYIGNQIRVPRSNVEAYKERNKYVPGETRHTGTLRHNR